MAKLHKFGHRVLFPANNGKVRVVRKLNWTKTLSLGWLRAGVKRGVRLIGLDHKEFSAHSLRAGGATDLFSYKVPYYIIKKMGRWTSDSAMLYFRNDEEVHEAVFSAFRHIRKTRNKFK